jgi:hypothetical protein
VRNRSARDDAEGGASIYNNLTILKIVLLSFLKRYIVMINKSLMFYEERKTDHEF